MNFVAVKMLTGDRAKYLCIIFAIACSTFLLENQSSIFAGIMKLTTSQIIDVTDADIWVMDPQTQYVDEVKSLTENDLYRVRGVPGVEWAVRLFKGSARATAPDGKFRQFILMGLAEAAQFEEIVILATPWDAVEATLKSAGGLCRGNRCRLYKSIQEGFFRSGFRPDKFRCRKGSRMGNQS